MHYVVLSDFSPLWGDDPASVPCILERLSEQVTVFVPVVHVEKDGTEHRTRFASEEEATAALEGWKNACSNAVGVMYHNPRVVTRTTP